MTAIDRLWPDAASDVADDELVARPASPWLTVNFVSSLDGAATVDGLSGGLSGAADKRVFELLRRAADAVLVGAGTVRAEGYGAMRVSDESAAWRRAHGLPPHPVFVIVSGSLDLDPASGIFTEAPVTPVLVTTERSSARRSAFEGLARVVVAGDDELEVPAMLGALRELGLDRILAEGGPSLFGTLLAAGAVDELRLTLGAVLVAGDAGRIARGVLPAPAGARLAGVLRSGDELLLRYLLHAEGGRSGE